MEQNKTKLYDKYYKLLLVIPAVIILFSFLYLGNFYSKNNDFIYKDISLTGGTTVTLFGDIDPQKLNEDLSPQIEDIITREIYDLITNERKAVIIETKLESAQTKTILENYLGYKLTSANSSFEFTGSTLSATFYNQLLTAIMVAFVLMGLVVFFIFSKENLIKSYSAILSLLIVKIFYSNIQMVNFLAIFLIIILIPVIFYFSFKQKKKYFVPLAISIISLLIIFFPFVYSDFSYVVIIALSIALGIIYFKFSIPSFAVIISAFADILMTLVLVDLLGIKMSSAGIVAFLMLIGYSVDTDILLTTRILKRSEGSLNQRMFDAFKTGITMTLTSLVAIGVAVIIVNSFSTVLTQIFSILFIGLCFDIFNTWVTNASIIKWYMERGK